ncbi:MAG TPA: hypothetical protein H9746_03540 [Candidatus Butyricicoccus avistercoris]|uniref:Uncharacterized protein n=1 Tax=Candidatus Butyricicoccus avistercoris TaxID=2838518 RepID=A0A9D1PGX5_9FIRM|nr:hypothetical protein [Candidatus Butyricicoccus avistercoris]
MTKQHWSDKLDILYNEGYIQALRDVHKWFLNANGLTGLHMWNKNGVLALLNYFAIHGDELQREQEFLMLNIIKDKKKIIIKQCNDK